MGDIRENTKEDFSFKIIRLASFGNKKGVFDSITTIFIEMVNEIKCDKNLFPLIKEELVEILKSGNSPDMNSVEKIKDTFNIKTKAKGLTNEIKISQPFIQFLIKKNSMMFREMFLGNQKKTLLLDGDALFEILKTIFNKRNFSDKELYQISQIKGKRIVDNDIDIYMILSRIYQSTFTNFANTNKCEKRLVFHPEKIYELKQRANDEYLVSFSLFEIIELIMFRLNASPDIRTIINLSDKGFEASFRIFMGSIAETATLPEKLKKLKELRERQKQFSLIEELESVDDFDVEYLEEL